MAINNQKNNGFWYKISHGNSALGTQTNKKSSSGSASNASASEATKVPETKAPTFSYEAYKPSDTVLQADALLQQQLANKPGEYKSTWQDQLNQTLQQILNRDKFSYDLNGDALYQQYKDQATTQGKLAMMDTMGQAAAMTGGYGNSYAQTAGQQAYQGYLQGLNDKIPELYQLALSQYNAEGDALRDQASIMAQMEDQYYGRYRDQLSEYYTELDRLTNDSRYQAEQDYNKWANDQSFGYQQYRDQMSDKQWQAQFDEAKRQYDEQTAFSKSKSSSTGSTSNNGNTGGNYNPEAAKKQQELVNAGYNVDVDGIWGPQSQAAWEKYRAATYQRTPYDDVVATLNKMVYNAGNPNSKEAMEELGRNIKAVLNESLEYNDITQEEYNRLWSLYGPIQNPYN